MLRLNELISAIRMAAAVGERPYGHFDHDANGVCGPTPSSPNGATASRPSLAPQATGPKLDDYVAFEDPLTGDLLYRPK